jgi:hypothetical protein
MASSYECEILDKLIEAENQKRNLFIEKEKLRQKKFLELILMEQQKQKEIFNKIMTNDNINKKSNIVEHKNNIHNCDEWDIL